MTERKQLSSFTGFIILAVSVCLAVLCAYLASFLARVIFMTLGLRGIPIDGIVSALFGIFVAVIIPLVLGTLVRRWAWMLGFCYSVLYVFVSLYWHSWSFRGEGGPWYETGRPLLTIALVIIPLATLASFVGQQITKNREGRLPLDIRRPLAIVLPIVAIAVIVASVATPMINKIKTVPPRILSFPEYHFEITKPAGWLAPSSHTTGTGDRIRRNAEWKQGMDTYSGTYTGTVDLTIFVYEKMPFSGEPVTSFSSPEALYEKLKQNLDEFSQNYEEILIDHVVAYEWHGDTEVGGVEGIKFKYDERRSPISGAPDTSFGPYDYDLFVYREPYLYCLNFFIASHIPEEKSREIFDELLDSFKFI